MKKLEMRPWSWMLKTRHQALRAPGSILVLYYIDGTIAKPPALP